MSSTALGEVKLWANAKEREKFENLAGAFAMVSGCQQQGAFACACAHARLLACGAPPVCEWLLQTPHTHATTGRPMQHEAAGHNGLCVDHPLVVCRSMNPRRRACMHLLMAVTACSSGTCGRRQQSSSCVCCVCLSNVLARPTPPAPHTHTTRNTDLFAILKCTEKLERAYVRDGIAAKDYEAQCEKLIAQFRMLWGSMKETVRRVGGWGVEGGWWLGVVDVIAL